MGGVKKNKQTGRAIHDTLQLYRSLFPIHVHVWNKLTARGCIRANEIELAGLCCLLHSLLKSLRSGLFCLLLLLYRYRYKQTFPLLSRPPPLIFFFNNFLVYIFFFKRDLRKKQWAVQSIKCRSNQSLT